VKVHVEEDRAGSRFTYAEKEGVERIKERRNGVRATTTTPIGGRGKMGRSRPSLLSNVSGDFGHKCRRLPILLPRHLFLVSGKLQVQGAICIERRVRQHLSSPPRPLISHILPMLLVHLASAAGSNYAGVGTPYAGL